MKVTAECNFMREYSVLEEAAQTHRLNEADNILKLPNAGSSGDGTTKDQHFSQQ
jgi:hypothetical protein